MKKANNMKLNNYNCVQNASRAAAAATLGIVLTCSSFLSACTIFQANRSLLASKQEMESQEEKFSPESSKQMLLEKALTDHNIGSVNDFLKSKSAQNAYFEAAQEYFGSGRFDRNDYNSIITSLDQIVNGTHPERQRVADELWKKPEGMGIYSIPVSTKSYGKKAFPEKLKAYVSKLFLRLSTDLDAILALEDADKELERVQALSAEIKKEVDDKLQAMQVLTQREQKGAKQKLFSELSQDRRSIQIVRYIARTALLKSPLLDNTIVNESDYFLSSYSEFYDSIKSTADALGIDYPGFSGTLGNEVQTLKALSENTALFFDLEMQGAKADYKLGKRVAADLVFYPVLRKFHAIFKGLTNRECVRTYPHRWGTVLLPGTQTHFVEQKGSYLGFIELGALELIDENGTPTGKKIYSPTFGAGQMGKQLIVADDSGKITSQLSYHYWLKKVMSILPPEFVGIGKSNATNARNAEQAIDKVMQSPTYLQAEVIPGQKGLSIGEQGQKFAEILKTAQNGQVGSYARPEFYYVLDIIESSSHQYRLLDLSKMPEPSEIKLQTVSSEISQNSCKAPASLFEIGNFNSAEEFLFLLNCLESEPVFQETNITEARKLPRGLFSDHARAFQILERTATTGDSEFQKVVADRRNIQRMLAILERFSKLESVRETVTLLKSMSLIIANLVPHELATTAFIQPAFELVGEPSGWDSATADILSAMTTAEKRRHIAMYSAQDLTLLDEQTAIERALAEMNLRDQN